RLPAGIQPFRVSGKVERYDAVRGGRPMRFIDRIDPAGEAECVCIAVGAEDSLYVTSDFLVTHNTLNDSFIILDEAQNTTPEQMKMFGRGVLGLVEDDEAEHHARTPRPNR